MIYLYGASGHAKVIADILRSQKKNISGFIDDNPNIKELLGYKVFGSDKDFSSSIISIGDNKTRKKIADKLQDKKFETAIHTSAIVSEYAFVDLGSVIMQGTVIQSSVKIGKHCIINTGATVDHDCDIGDFVHISPHATLCGNVTVGEGTWIGAGTVVIQGVKIGKWSMIAAGSVVTKNIPDNVLAAGNRCKVIKELNNSNE